jgi:RNA-directed DNA polymerase
MNVEQSMCASSGETNQWNQRDWSHCERQLRRLQARIVKATQEGRWGKVKALQRLLTHSHYGRALAVKRVTENKGKRTPGVDGEIWQTPGAKEKAMESLRQRGYQPKPLRRVHIPKANGKLRPLGIPTMKDRAMQALHLLALEPVAEATADGHSYGFRPGRSTADAIGQCFLLLSKGYSPQWVLEGDIRGCFDNISHEWMLQHIPLDGKVLKKWLKAGYVENRTLFPTEAGTPQGGIISPTLANLTLDGLGRLLRDTFRPRKAKGKTSNPKVHLVRYADDFIITGDSKELLENEVRPLVEQFLRDRGLEFSPEKTCVTHISEGFDFLGQNLRKYGDKLLIQPSKKNTHRFLDKVREEVRRNRAAKQEDLIRVLNPLIRGWTNYHRHVAASKAFSRTRKEIWHCLWRWARRRHPTKSAEWVAMKYWQPLGRKRVFAADSGERETNGKVIWTRLVDPMDVKICRHCKIRSEANPFDPQWHRYFQQRALVKWYGKNPFGQNRNPS